MVKVQELLTEVRAISDSLTAADAAFFQTLNALSARLKDQGRDDASQTVTIVAQTYARYVLALRTTPTSDYNAAIFTAATEVSEHITRLTNALDAERN